MKNKTSILSSIGIAIGAIALLLSLTHFWAGPFAPKPDLHETVAEKAAAFKEATMAAIKGEKLSAPKADVNDIDKTIDILTAISAGLAIVLGVVGYARKEPIHSSSGAVFLGVSAITFQLLTLFLTVT